MATSYKFCFGPWNISEGADPYGPATRPPQSFDWKLAAMKKIGFDAMMFHDDDAVPDIDGKSPQQIRKETRELKKKTRRCRPARGDGRPSLVVLSQHH